VFSSFALAVDEIGLGLFLAECGMIFGLMAMVIVFIVAVAVTEVLSSRSGKRDRGEVDRTKADREKASGRRLPK
jgi:hypothetical protein